VNLKVDENEDDGLAAASPDGLITLRSDDTTNPTNLHLFCIGITLQDTECAYFWSATAAINYTI